METLNISQSILSECKQRLLEAKTELLTRYRSNHEEYQSRDRTGGDEMDQTMDILAENQFVTSQERIRSQILEIETALAKMDKGLYGICEETEEHIEPDRLLAIPWTRLSIEGAEIREQNSKRYAR